MNVLIVLHSYLRWILLILLLASIFKGLSGLNGRKTLTAGDKKIWLFTMITAHITLLVGLILLFVGRIGFTNIPEGVSVMKDATYRFFLVEHPLLMIIAIVFITIGRGQAKKSIPDAVKYKKAFWFFLLALILILAAIPWPSREIGRPLFPSM
jgi:heme/copper-type cytochrome/quinol oxidase subunit 1